MLLTSDQYNKEDKRGTEPPNKKIKTEWTLKAIVADDMLKPIPLTPAIAITVKDKKLTSRIVKYVSFIVFIAVYNLKSEKRQ